MKQYFLLGCVLATILPGLAQTTGPLQLQGREPRHAGTLTSSRYQALLFMSPECPLCENYSATLRSLRTEFSAEQVTFVGVFSGEWYSREDIISFLARFQAPVRVLYDPDYHLKTLYKATVTPEVVVIDREGRVQYQGKIDNWVVALGKKRTQTTEFYLRDALLALIAGREPVIRQTEPVGCFIE